MNSDLRIFGGPRRYLQGPGAIDSLAAETLHFGRRPILLTDSVVCDALENSLRPTFPNLEVVLFCGQCTASEIARVAQIGRSAACDVVIGAGGGKALDVAKAVASDLGHEVVIVPTVASNDAATSRLSVIYDESNAIAGVRMMALNPCAVIVDTTLILGAPKRFFVAGIGDALSKHFEANQCRDANGRNFYGGRPPLLAQVMADACYHTLRENAVHALTAFASRQLTDAFERTVEAAVLLSGLAFESGGLSIAHAMTRGLSAAPDFADALHGEQVAYGLIVQRVIEGASAGEMRDLRGFMADVGLPRNLRELAGIEIASGESIAAIAERTVRDASHHLRHFSRPIACTDLIEAMRLVEDASFAFRGSSD
ncbi:MAG: glycerol dehydrogenase [Proteobacteria bacterium]|nr:glycerol dehydrogenase [Pseudomonadota bacterium]MDA1331788.1 glycerol dehydrogenase [Pseudomonadota bacterium]